MRNNSSPLHQRSSATITVGEENHVIYTSGWLHIEAGMALALKQNVYVLSEKNIVSDGIFDRDWNSCNVIEIDSLDNYENKIDDFISYVVNNLN